MTHHNRWLDQDPLILVDISTLGISIYDMIYNDTIYSKMIIYILDRYIHLGHLDASAVCIADRVECLRVSVVAGRRWVGSFEMIWRQCPQNLTECLYIVSVDISTKLTFWGWLSEQALVINQSATWKIHSNGNWNLLISLYWNLGVAL